MTGMDIRWAALGQAQCLECGFTCRRWPCGKTLVQPSLLSELGLIQLRSVSPVGFSLPTESVCYTLSWERAITGVSPSQSSGVGWRDEC